MTLTRPLLRHCLVVCVMATVFLSIAQAKTAPAALAEPPTAALFEDVRIFDGKSAKLSAPSNVLVLRNQISQISTAPIAAPAGAAVTTIQGGGRTLMPGLIDNHVHFTFSANTQQALIDPNATIESINANATDKAQQILLRGFTSVRDLGGPMFDLERAVDQGQVPGPRIYSSGATISQTSRHADSRLPHEKSRRWGGEVSLGELTGAGYIADGRDEVLTATGENLRGGATTVYDPLDVAQCMLDEIKAAVDATANWGPYVTLHAYTPRAVRRAVEAGVKSIEHGQLLDEATIKLLGKRGIWLSLQVLEPAPPRATDDALADLLLVNVNPLANIDLVADSEKNFAVIMKDSKFYKNLLS